MLSEEAFLLVVFLGAVSIVFLGTLELIWPTRPRHPVRRGSSVSRDPWRRARARGILLPERAPVVAAAAEPPSALPPTPTPAPVWPVASEASSLAVVAEPVPLEESPAEPAPAPLTLVPPIAEPAPEPRRSRPRTARLRLVPRDEALAAPALSAEPEPAQEEITAPVEIAASPGADEPVVDRCFALLAGGSFADVSALAEEALASRRSSGALTPSAEDTRETTRLWGVLGLAKQGVGDLDGARFSFEEAIALAPQTERATWERNLASLALTTARRSLEAGAAEPARPERIESVRSALDWVERGLAVAPDDGELRETGIAAREALWRTHEEVIRGFVQRKNFAEARRLLDDVMGDPECPPARQRAFRTLWGSMLGGEIGQATAKAIRLIQGGREDEAVAALARAGSVMAQVPADAVSPKRRQELERRLWWGYMKLGVTRLEAGAREDAVGPLFEALGFKDIGEERVEETRATLLRALEEVVEVRAVEIGALIDAGDPAAAAIQGDKLWSFLRSAVDQGLPQEQLSDAFARTSVLFQRIGAERT